MELEEVLEKVRDFLKKAGHTFPKIYEVKQVGNSWKVKAELGWGKFARIKVDDKTGKVVEFYEETTT